MSPENSNIVCVLVWTQATPNAINVLIKMGPDSKTVTTNLTFTQLSKLHPLGGMRFVSQTGGGGLSSPSSPQRM